ncbi:hypothetical protein BS47DRAFT_465390 [Hydnum rufescens UP504]|uniref:BTB domain-containing protein n=1 Tax=Hydnum rufescens UP504 TaxID=1448309 RepID=A0A9P6B4P2_9AGAM|nr:hypothetical protein BS47DRAFT_213410 [Hydnum rufescens UP504]KAF9517601.1 hypothetical protein BS47DRAFT_465390 [Hydnum rufescens UP504]
MPVPVEDPFPFPLSFDDGDVILRAGDAEFKVHICLLRLVSPFFRTMFSLPQPNVGKSEIPVIPMDDNAASLDFVLRSIYPLKRPLATSIEQAQKVLEVAEKLDVEYVAGAVRTSLSELLAAEPNPLRSWAIATRHGLEGAQKAAILRFDPNSYRPSATPPRELLYVNGLQYHELVEARKKSFGIRGL